MGNSQGKPVVFTDEGTSHPSAFDGDLQAGCHDPLISISPYSRPLENSTDNWFVAVNLNHFRLLRVVGKGAFGKVRIVERKDTGLTFALKYIRKDEGSWIRR